MSLLVHTQSDSGCMAPLGWSGGSQFSSTVLPDGVSVTVSIRGGERAEGMAVDICTQVHLRKGKMC